MQVIHATSNTKVFIFICHKKVDNKWVWCYNTCIEFETQEKQMAYFNQDRKSERAQLSKQF